jgi:biotin operon repressor
MQSIARSASPCREAPADCRHSREPFDAAFRVINRRDDIGPTAKLVHAHLVTLHRTGAAATQAEIGAAIGCSRHQVWRAMVELADAGLVVVTCRGQGRPNAYELIGVDLVDLDGRASRSRPAGQPGAGRPGTDGPRSYRKKEDRRMMRDPGTVDYLETRYGRLTPRGT